MYKQKADYTFYQKITSRRLNSIVGIHSKRSLNLSKQNIKSSSPSSTKITSVARHFKNNQPKISFERKKVPNPEEQGIFKANQIIMKEKSIYKTKEDINGLHRNKISLMASLISPQLSHDHAPKRHMDHRLIQKFQKRNMSISHMNPQKDDLDIKHKNTQTNRSYKFSNSKGFSNAKRDFGMSPFQSAVT